MGDGLDIDHHLDTDGPAAADPPYDQHTEQMPRVRINRAGVVGSTLFIVSIVAFLYLVLPRLLGLHSTWNRLKEGDDWWLALAAALEVLSYLGYVMLFRAVFARGAERIGWYVSYEITMAGLAATRLFAAAGAGGVALTAWALRRSGMEPRLVACRMIAFMSLLYGVYMLALFVDGLALYAGLWGGSAPFAITIVPAIFGGVMILLFLAVSALPGDFERLVARWTSEVGVLGSVARRVATAPAAAASGVRTAIALVRTRDPALLGALAWWGFDIATLWACFHAFGASPSKAIIIMAYFVGWIANALPLPGGVGAVEGGLIGALTAFGIPVQTAVVSVLAYRAFSFWIPTFPGAIAYLQLRRTINGWRRADGPRYS